jgi:hypothetical protein
LRDASSTAPMARTTTTMMTMRSTSAISAGTIYVGGVGVLQDRTPRR